MDAQMIINIYMGGIIFIEFIMIVFIMSKLYNLKKRLREFLPDNKEIDVERMLVEYDQNVKETLSSQKEVFNKIEKTKEQIYEEIESTNKLICLISEKLKNAVQKIGVIRYNPFEDVGGDLCYAVALLDDNNNGVVINSIYARDSCYSYAKEIIKGESLKHKLSDEETEALNKAMGKYKQ